MSGGKTARAGRGKIIGSFQYSPPQRVKRETAIIARCMSVSHMLNVGTPARDNKKTAGVATGRLQVTRTSSAA
jgi:hypothetical protein